MAAVAVVMSATEVELEMSVTERTKSLVMATSRWSRTLKLSSERTVVVLHLAESMWLPQPSMLKPW